MLHFLLFLALLWQTLANLSPSSQGVGPGSAIWSKHVWEDRDYWYNKITGVSTWDDPNSSYFSSGLADGQGLVAPVQTNEEQELYTGTEQTQWPTQTETQSQQWQPQQQSHQQHGLDEENTSDGHDLLNNLDNLNDLDIKASEEATSNSKVDLQQSQLEPQPESKESEEFNIAHAASSSVSSKIESEREGEREKELEIEIERKGVAKLQEASQKKIDKLTVLLHALELEKDSALDEADQQKARAELLQEQTEDLDTRVQSMDEALSVMTGAQEAAQVQELALLTEKHTKQLRKRGSHLSRANKRVAQLELQLRAEQEDGASASRLLVKVLGLDWLFPSGAFKDRYRPKADLDDKEGGVDGEEEEGVDGVGEQKNRRDGKCISEREGEREKGNGLRKRGERGKRREGAVKKEREEKEQETFILRQNLRALGESLDSKDELIVELVQQTKRLQGGLQKMEQLEAQLAHQVSDSTAISTASLLREKAYIGIEDENRLLREAMIRQSQAVKTHTEKVAELGVRLAVLKGLCAKLDRQRNMIIMHLSFERDKHAESLKKAEGTRVRLINTERQVLQLRSQLSNLRTQVAKMATLTQSHSQRNQESHGNNGNHGNYAHVVAQPRFPVSVDADTDTDAAIVGNNNNNNNKEEEEEEN